MSFNWASVEEREQKKHEDEKQLKSFLLQQQDEIRKRKQEAKMKEIEESKKFFTSMDTRGPAPTQKQDSPYTKNYTTFSDAKLAPNANGSTSPSPGMLSALHLTPINGGALSASTSPKSLMSHSFGPTLDIGAPASSLSQSMSLKYLEDRLDSERRAREQLEGELRLGKSLITQLSSRLELLQNQIHIQQQKNLNSFSSPETQEQGMSKQQMKKEMEKMAEAMQNKLIQMMNDHINLKTKLHDVHDSDTKRYKSVLDELDQMKISLSSFMTKSSELHQEHQHKDTMLMSEQAKAAEVQQFVYNLSLNVQQLEKTVESKMTSTDQSISLVKNDISRLVIREDTLKKQLDQFSHDIYLDHQKQLQAKIMPLETDIKTLSVLVNDLSDSHRADQDKLKITVSEQLHQANQRILDTKAMMEDALQAKLKTVEEWFAQDQNQAAKRDLQIRTDTEHLIRAAEGRLQKEMTSLRDDLKAKFNHSVKGLQQAIHLVEEMSSSKLDRMEKVIKAEIEHRMEQQKRMDSLIHSLQDSLKRQDLQFSESITQCNNALTDTTTKVDALQLMLHESYATKETMRRELELLQTELQDKMNSLTVQMSAQIEEHTSATNSFVKSHLQHLEESDKNLETGLKRNSEVLSAYERNFSHLKEKMAVLQQVKLESDEMKNTVQQLAVWKLSADKFLSEDPASRNGLDSVKARLDGLSDKVTRLEISSHHASELAVQQLEQDLVELRRSIQSIDTYTKEQLTTMQFKLDENLTEERIQGIQQEFNDKLNSVHERIKLSVQDVENLEKQLAGKANGQQFEAVDIQVKSLKDTLNALSVWVHESANKQSNDIHKILIDLCQQMTLKQTNQSRNLNELRTTVDTKMESLTLMVHEHTKKNSDIEDSMKQRIRNSEETIKTQLDALRQSIKQANVFQESKFSEFEMNLQNAAEMNAAYITSKLAEFASKNDLQMMSSEMRLIESKLSDLQAKEKTALTEIESRLNNITRELLTKPESEEKVSREIRIMKDSLRNLHDMYDKQHSSQQEALDGLQRKISEAVLNGVDAKSFKNIMEQVNMLEREMYSKISETELKFKVQQYLSELNHNKQDADLSDGDQLSESRRKQNTIFKPNFQTSETPVEQSSASLPRVENDEEQDQ